MKLLPLIFLLMAIQMSLAVYYLSPLSNNGATGPYNASSASFFCHYNNNYSNYNDANTSVTVSGSDYNGGDIWNTIFCPANGNSSRMILYLIAFALLIGAVGFIPFINRSDLSLLSGPFIFILCAGAPTIIQVYTFLNSEVSAIACGTAVGACFMGQFVAILIAGTLLITWIMACTEWLSGRPAS